MIPHLDSAVLTQALRVAMEAGDKVRGTTSPNPPVGAVILDSAGRVVGVGATQPPGGPHAEVMALRDAGDKARGGTAVVSLEPCNHTGRTGPCAQALIDASVAAVYFLHPDPTPEAGGGAATLRGAGIAVGQIEAPDGVSDALAGWLGAVRLGRPHVTLKFAQSLDGFTAAVDGSSQWITGEQAREHVHRDRSKRDAILIGTGTALADNPSLTARYRDGSLRETQPRRVVIGSRDVDRGGSSNLAKLGFEHYATPQEALAELYATGARDILVEGGAGLATSFMELGSVDSIQAYIGNVILGQGRGVLTRAIASNLALAPRWQRAAVTELGADLLVEYRKNEK
ncbi:bifunctional diaminohydroxyphosphoribosylaminopyrimidine deaminase/5-amino-6-(5-phosphoribosylamino)uracil reductase RibD [Corynebacterium hesseae]|uniref:bifunctional diaminohydroxyphosphoribosylaminopyrimidine deaminase/5-amino-6-(5-phosphoribosylamino)uracil reductase RibD n=1 Tax=Corynebacterium hesseae TaxID=2913502 RepID=UPI00373EA8AF